MYWLQEDNNVDASSLGNVKGSLEYMNDLLSSIKEGMNPKTIEKFFLKLEEEATKANAVVTTQFKSLQNDLQNTIFNVYSENLKIYGFQQSEITNFVTTMASQLERAIPFTTENTKQALILSKAMGITAQEMGTYYGTLMKAGLSQESSNELLKNVYTKARQFGLDSKKLTDSVTSNIQKASMYNFKDGIDGLTKMAANSQKINLDMSYAFTAAEKLRDLDTVMTSASDLQMLGGAFSQMADPLSMYSMALTDTEKLQNTMGKALSQYVEMDKKTGMIKIQSTEAMLLMKEAAGSFGLSYEQAFDMASKFQKQNLFEKYLSTTTLSEEQKNLVYSFGEMVKNNSGGFDLKVKIPGQDAMVNVQNLTAKQLEELQKAQDDSKKGPEEVAKDQLSVLKQIDNSLKDIQLSGARGAFDKSKDIIDMNKFRAEKIDYTNLKDEMSLAGETLMTEYYNTFDNANLLFKDAVKNSETFISNLSDVIKTTITAAGGIAEALAQLIKGDSNAALTTTINTFNQAYTELKTTFDSLNLDLDTLNTKLKDFLKNITGETDIETVLDILPDTVKQKLGIASLNPTSTVIGTPPSSPIQNINDVTSLKQTNINQNATISGGAEITIKLDSGNVNEEILSKLVDSNDLKNKVEGIVTERLSQAWSRKIENDGYNS